MKKIQVLAVLLAVLLVLPGMAMAAENEAPRFTDVAPGAWYADAVADVSAKGLMAGTAADMADRIPQVLPLIRKCVVLTP